MRILFLRTDHYGAITDGGSLTMQKGMLRGLINAGHSVEVVRSCPMPIPEGIPEYVVAFNQLFTNVPEILTIPHNFRVVRFLRTLLSNKSKEQKPAFIYQRHSGYNITGAMVYRSLGIPYLLQFDGSEVWMKKHWSKTYFPTLLKWAEDIALRYAFAITVVSEPMKKIVVDLGVDEHKVFVIANGVDPTVFTPDIPSQSVRDEYNLQGKFVVGFVGTFAQWHGVLVLARAMKAVIDVIPTAHVLFVGDGVLRSEVQRIFRENSLEDCCTFTGSQDHARIPSFIAACDVMTSPTVHNEDGTEFFGSPTKLFEYMAMQKACIVSPIGQIKNIIEDGVDGLYAESGNSSSLSEAIIRAATDDDLRLRIAKNARDKAVNEYDWRVHAEKIINAYRTIAAQELPSTK